MRLAMIKGDLFANPSEALVNPVNCVGVMGAGLAKQFKQRFKENYSAYRRACDHRTVAPGRMFVYDYGAGWLLPPRYIINFPTKRHYRDPSRMADIEAGLDGLRETIVDRRIQSVSIPALGAGLGGLNWVDVRLRIRDALGDLDGVAIELYEPVFQGAAPKPDLPQASP